MVDFDKRFGDKARNVVDAVRKSASTDDGTKLVLRLMEICFDAGVSHGEKIGKAKYASHEDDDG